MKNKTIVLGLGNPLMGDEGVGIYIINEFLKRKNDFTQAEFVDAGTSGMSILHLLEGYEKAVFIDCAVMQTTPGTIKKFSPADIESVKNLMHYSLHEADLLKIIDLARQLGQCPTDVVIFGIEPQTIGPQSKLSQTLGDNIQDYFATITAELTE